ncbi:thioredoxin 1 [Leifsonia sp. AK011]|uniref:thioredoxin family protein n=1 Tax=Leifsonia sp. AK011 TaxID=2723075 RepID=UPI0015C755D2|nr:thioredoxin domain-containing protein [Leifsonia sp. AK011]NYF10568.1 thioredoxin 1 [Leifsonia sp. AK011]
MGTLGAVTDDTFESAVLAASGVVIVDFWAEWCPPCKHLEPVLEQLASEHPEITIVKMDADANPERTIEYGALSLPTLKVFVDGRLDRTLVGAKPRAALERELAKYLTVP